MISRIRDVRRAKGLTLEAVAARCDPPTTAQTVGRLETGMRTVSVRWLNRIAAALDVTAAELVDVPESTKIAVVALIGGSNAVAPTRSMTLVPPAPCPGALGIRVQAAIGDYRTGDELWCEQLEAGTFSRAINRDILAPRSGGRFVFGRLLGQEGGAIHVQPPGLGQRQVVIPAAPWIAMPVRLVRAL